MSGLVIGELAALIGLIILSAGFSSAETALFSLSPLHIHRISRHHPKEAKRIEQLLVAPASLLSTILIGNTVVNIAAANLGYVIAEQVCPHFGVWIAIPSVTLLLVIFGEFAPKRLAVRHPDRLALSYLTTLTVVIRLFAPLHALLETTTHLLRHHLIPHRAALSDDELLTAVDAGHEEGVINKEERSMVDGVIRLERLQAKDIMTPRVDLIGIDLEDDPALWPALCRRARFRFLPVYTGDLDHVKGFLDVARYLMDPGSEVTSTLQPHFYVPDTATLDSLLTLFQQQSRRVAIVIDEYGGTAGLVTLGDILDEIAEFSGERDGQSTDISPAGVNRWMVNGSTSLEEVNYELDLALSVDGADRIAGWVTAQARRFPKSGDTIETQSARVTVLQMRKHRITRVLIEKPAPAPDAGEEDAI